MRLYFKSFWNRMVFDSYNNNDTYLSFCDNFSDGFTAAVPPMFLVPAMGPTPFRLGRPPRCRLCRSYRLRRSYRRRRRRNLPYPPGPIWSERFRGGFYLGGPFEVRPRLAFQRVRRRVRRRQHRRAKYGRQKFATPEGDGRSLRSCGRHFGNMRALVTLRNTRAPETIDQGALRKTRKQRNRYGRCYARVQLLLLLFFFIFLFFIRKFYNLHYINCTISIIDVLCIYIY